MSIRNYLPSGVNSDLVFPPPSSSWDVQDAGGLDAYEFSPNVRTGSGIEEVEVAVPSAGGRVLVRRYALVGLKSNADVIPFPLLKFWLRCHYHDGGKPEITISSACKFRLVSSGGSLRNELSAANADNPLPNGTPAGVRFDFNTLGGVPDPLLTNDGDFILVEIGFVAPSNNGGRSVVIEFGDPSAPDLAGVYPNPARFNAGCGFLDINEASGLFGLSSGSEAQYHRPKRRRRRPSVMEAPDYEPPASSPRTNTFAANRRKMNM